MANKESTAVNALIDLAQAKPMGKESGPAEGLFNAPRPAQPPAPLPRLRAPGGTSQLKLPDVPASRVRMVTAPPSRGETIPPLKQQSTLPPPRPSGTLPPPRPSGTPRPTITKPIAAPVAAAPSAPIAPPIATKPPVPAPWSPPPVPKPVQQPPSRPIQASPFASMPGLPPSRVDRTGDFVNADSWFESSRAVEKFDEETFVGTAPVVRLERRRKMAVLKIVATSVVFVVIGVVIGSYIAFSSDIGHPAKSKTPTSTPTVAKAPAPTPTIVQALPAQPETPAAPAPAAKLADIRIDSTPSGATVMLVDNGKTSLLGTTPIATALDPARSYDVILTVEGRPSKMAHLDPATAPHLEVALDKLASPPPAVAEAHVAAAKPAAPVATPAPVRHHVAAARTAPIGQIADPGFDTPSKASAPAGGNGTLMISSKPPCEIVVDGKATGLSTPQRALPLSAGAHKITFVNAAEHINKTVGVSITADQTTKLVKDLLN